MKVRDGVRLRKIVDEWILIPNAGNMVESSALFSVNETAAFIWRLLENDIEYEECLDHICKEYGIERIEAEIDLKDFLNVLNDNNLLN